MFWINIAIDFMIGGLSAFFAYLFVKNPKKKRWLFVGVMVICFIPINLLFSKIIRPQINTWYLERSIENAFADSPLYKEIRKLDPQSSEIIKAEVRNVIKYGVSPEEAIHRVGTIVFQFGMKYIPLSSDDALISCMEAFTRTMEELTQQDPSLTYKWLFPEQYGYVRAEKYVKKETKTFLMNALADVVRTGASNPKASIDSEEAEKSLGKVRSRLFAKYGKELEVLSDFNSPQVDRKKACYFMIDLYNEILKLPRRESCTLFRYLLTSEGT
jgi:hypothetical protein